MADAPTPGRFEGSVVVVTGAGGGQGRAEAKRFASEGALVIATDVDETGSAETVRAMGARGIAVRHDIVREDEWAAVIDAALQKWGKIDALVNNAGIYWQSSIEHETADGFRRMLDVNLVGAFLGTRAVISPMREAGGGAIVNVSSTAGCSGFPQHVAYGAAKWGLRGLTRTSAVELGPLGIRVNCVVPGAVDTAMRPSDAPTTSRVASPEEIAAIVCFVASSDAATITGSDIIADGGFLVGMGHSPLAAR
ncbi:MAG TPA: SDR family NAD(P)-dependent oxidoreductase [Ilumatobacter sp.]|nr:SDR family NAD(P)-dependent oxidoreductase [Ilumatobacter sp.]